MNWLEFAMLHAPAPTTVRVTARQGEEPIVVGPCVVNHTTRPVPAGEGLVLSTVIVFCPPDTVAPPGSLVTLPGGKTSRVLNASFLDAHGFRLPGHWQLDLE
ncbi:hypothetical protein [Actinoplanes sp. NPDC051851]|uniref:hypothetical protein n=1 Tax=Actinoplanes sp. NPDC051851 TaxID=3154753 RepID=UPI003444A0E5